MRLVIEKCICDVCKKEVEKITTVNYPVIFHTEETEGRSCSPYISKEKLDMCDECIERVLMLDGWGSTRGKQLCYPQTAERRMNDDL